MLSPGTCSLSSRCNDHDSNSSKGEELYTLQASGIARKSVGRLCASSIIRIPRTTSCMLHVEGNYAGAQRPAQLWGGCLRRQAPSWGH